MTGRGRGLCVLTVSWLLLVHPVLGQGTESTLANTMNFIANALNNRGNISWTETMPEVFGASYTITSSLTAVNADSSACSLSWTSVYTSSEDKLVETDLVRLEMVSSVRVQPYSEYRKPEWVQKVEVSPETYVLVMKTDAPLARHRELYHKNKLKSETKLPSDREGTIVFADEQTADKVADGIRQAAKSCRESKPIVHSVCSEGREWPSRGLVSSPRCPVMPLAGLCGLSNLTFA